MSESARIERIEIEKVLFEKCFIVRLFASRETESYIILSLFLWRERA